MNRRGIGYEVNPDFESLIAERIEEPWEVPDWKRLDLIHSSTPTPGMHGRTRKVHLGKEMEDLPLRPPPTT